MDCLKCGYSAGPEDEFDRCPMCGASQASLARDGEPRAEASDFWSRRGGLMIVGGVVLVGLILLLVLLGGGIGGSSGGGGQPALVTSTQASLVTATQAQVDATYTDAALGYSFEYPATWQELVGTPVQGAAGAAAAGRVSVVDPSGTLAADSYVDLANVSVYRLTASVDETMMDAVRPEVEQVVAGLISQGNKTEVLAALEQTTAAGMPGFKTTLSFEISGVPVTSTMYFLFSGDLEYQLTIQATTQSWQAKLPILEAIVASLRPGSQ